MGPYKKQRISEAIECGWTIENGDGETIAHLDTETMADVLIAGLQERDGALWGKAIWSDEDIRINACELGISPPLTDEEVEAAVDYLKDSIQDRMIEEGNRMINEYLCDEFADRLPSDEQGEGEGGE